MGKRAKNYSLVRGHSMRRAPRTNEVEWKQYYQLLHTHPEQYLRIADDTIRQYPDDPQGYRDCVTYWMHFEQYDCALCDIDHALALRDNTMTRVERGVVLRCLGRYREAIEELSRCEAKAAGMYSPLIEINRAACHARLGNLEAALADCARLPDDHCMPGFDGALGAARPRLPGRRLPLAALDPHPVKQTHRVCGCQRRRQDQSLPRPSASPGIRRWHALAGIGRRGRHAIGALGRQAHAEPAGPAHA